MADNANYFHANEVEIGHLLNTFERPIHESVLSGRILCAKDNCIAQRAFFHENGIVHHFRVKHKDEFSFSEREKSLRTRRQLHEQETRECVEKIFEHRTSKNEVEYLDVRVTSCGRNLDCVVHSEREAVQWMCLLLYHGGTLSPYSKGNKPCDVEIARQGLHAKFHCWYIDPKDKYTVSFQTECFFVKRDHRSDITTSFGDLGIVDQTASDGELQQMSEDPLLDILQKVFHHENFRGMQREVIDQIMDNKDILTIIPTGGGKSLCYWIPGMATLGVTVVITPLIALLNDQVAKLRNHGINVCCISSSMSSEERDLIFHELTKEVPSFKLFYLTPESALSPHVTACFKQMVANKTLARFIIDEAHCVDTWGQSFRPSYGCLHELKQFERPIAAFTGTATTQTQKRIVEKLGLVEPVILQSTCNRPNLFYKVLSKGGPHAKEELVSLVQDNFHNQCGIVYCLNTKDTVELAYIFKSKGLSAVYYHGQLDYFERSENAKAWLSGKAQIMCATSAFGMGIDKPNVRFVIHLSIPKSLEEFYQEAGRAGRDGQNSQCVLMFRFEDRSKLIQLIASSESEEQREYLQHSLDAVVSYCMSSLCRRKLILEYFGDTSAIDCNGTCDNCLKPPSLPKEYTTEAINVCCCVEEMCAINAKINVRQLALTFKGSKSKRDVESKGFQNIPHYGVGQKIFKNDGDAIKFVQHLIINDVLTENIRGAVDRFTTPFITLGKKAALLKNREINFFLRL